MRRALATALAAGALAGLAAPASAGWLRDRCTEAVPFRAAPACFRLPDNP
jgi:hypothetical protein